MLAVSDASWYPNCRRMLLTPHYGGKVIRGSRRVGHLETSVWVNAGGPAEKVGSSMNLNADFEP